MWHVSIKPLEPMSPQRVVSWARRTLKGVGYSGLGEWVASDNPGPAGSLTHLRRRLTPFEAKKVGPIRDIRGTPEAEERLDRVRDLLPEGWSE